MNEPWIKLYRKFVEWEWYADINCKVVFLHLLLTANWKPKKWQGRTIEVGETVTSYPILAEELQMSERQVRTAVEKLIKSETVSKQSTNRFSVFKILNYEKYQQTNDRQETLEAQGFQASECSDDVSQMTDRSQADDRQMTPPKEYIEYNNNRIIDSSSSGIINNIYNNNITTTTAAKIYQDNIGPITPRIADILSERIEAQGEELVQLAIEEAIECNVRNIRYIEKILLSWQDAGMKTPEDVRLRKAERKVKSDLPRNVQNSKFRNYDSSIETITEGDKAFIEKMMREYEECG